jgi:hypothetical protein
MTNFNLDYALQLLQQFRSQLDAWGVNNRGLWLAGALAALFFVLSVREVFCWFFQIHKVRDEVRSLRRELAELKGMFSGSLLAGQGQAQNSSRLPAEELIRIAEGLRDDKANSLKFRVDH